MTENVECSTCDGRGWIVVNQTIGWPHGEQVQCPDCTPENVETPRWRCSCGQTFTHGYGAHPCPDNGGREVRRMKPIEVEFTPENVEKP